MKIGRLALTPARIVLLYFGSWFMFGVLYSFLPNGFFHATSALEPERLRDKATVENLIEGKLRQSAVEFKSQSSRPFDRLSSYGFTVPETLSVFDLELKGDMVCFRIEALHDGYQDYRESDHVVTTLQFNLRSAILKESATGLLYSVFRLDLSHTDPDPDLRKKFLTTLCPKPEDRDGVKPSIWLTDEDFLLLEHYYQAMNGRPGMPGNVFRLDHLVRMLHFSAATITTTGYGDIVPTTTATRAWAMIESLLGVLLAGMFINSVFSNSKEKPGDGGANDSLSTAL